MITTSQEIILKYKNYVESFKGIEEFGIDDRKKYSLSFFGRIIQKIKVYFFLIIIPKSGSSLNKYIFEGYRFKNIIELFDSNDYSVIAGLSNIFNSIKSKKTFIWGGGIIAAFEISLHLGKHKYLNKVIQRLDSWSRESQQVILFLYEDTQPLGLVLSTVFSKSKSITTVCIAHGFYPASKKEVVFPGNNCNFNFVWDSCQKKFFKTEKNSVIYLGLPYEYNVINIVDINNIILVGHSGPETNFYEYLLTYSHLFFIYNLLKENNISVKFKPHPQDNNFYAKKFFNDDITTDIYKEMGGGAILLGFFSSILYEAQAHGLHVIGLDTSLLSHDRSYQADKSFKSDEYINIPSYLVSLNLTSNNKIDPLPLEKRFYNAVSSIQNN